MVEKSYNKTDIDFNFGRHKDLSTLKYNMTFSGRKILMSSSWKSIIVYEPRHEKTGFLYMRNQRRRSASR